MIGKKIGNKYYGDENGEGVIFKDKDAFLNDKDAICYIAECGFFGGADEKNWALTEEEARAEIEKGGAETYNSIFEFTKSALESEFEKELTDEFVAWACDVAFDELEWTCYSTCLEEIDFAEDLEYYETMHQLP